MNKLLCLSLVASLLAFTVTAQPIEKIFESENLRVEYHQNNGMFDGHYTSYYANGAKKAEGSFANNQRIGEWLVWDENGDILVQREYKTSLDFVQTNPINKNIISSPNQRNDNGVIDYFMIKEENVGWIQRIWRAIPEENNINLFDDNRLFQIMHENLVKGTITGYSPETDDFSMELKGSDIDFSNTQVLSFKIKEESFFDSKRMVMESRIIGICPVVLDEEIGSPKDLVWIYYPDFRSILAQYPVMEKRVPEYVRSMDDIFFYRFFASQIIKVSNLNDRAIEDYKDDAEIEEEATKFELLSIEREHDSWVK